MIDEDGQPHWTRILGVGLVVVMLSAAAFVFLGSPIHRILSTVGASVGSTGGGVRAGPLPDGVAQDPANEGDSPADEPPADGASTATGFPVSAVSRPGLLVVKTGTLSLQVGNVDAALAAAGDAIGSLGGYAAGSDRRGSPEQPEASVTYRIPSASWEVAFDRLRGLAQQVLAEHASTEDVTSKVVDLGARITNLQATERALQAIMDRATVIKDVLSVQSELTKVRGQIEELSAQKGHLEEQAAYSTLEVTFEIKAPNPVKVEQAGFDPGGEVDRASARLVGIGQDAAVLGIWFGIVWLPILIAFGVVGGIAYLGMRRFRRASRGGA
jgi:hypothetical protein